MRRNLVLLEKGQLVLSQKQN